MEEIVIRLDEHNLTQIDGIITNGFRWLGWALIKILGTIVNGMESVVTKIYNLNGFFNSPEVNDLINRYKPLIWIILSLSIAMLGMKIIFNKKQDKGQLPSNLIFSVVVIVLLPTLMIKLNDMTSLAVKSTTSEYTSSANELVKNSIYDLHYLDSINYKLDGATNKIPSDKIFRIDENELVDIKKVKNEKVMKHKVVIETDGELKVEKLEKGWFEIDEEYYRYSMDFVSIIVTLGAMAITLLCVALKVARLLFELAFDKLFATLFAFADIDDGKKVKEIVKHIITTFIIIFATAMMTKLYVIFTAWLGSSLGNAGLDANGLAKIVVLVGVSIAVVNGPALIERILGMDAGVKSGWGAAMAGYGLAKGAASSAKGIVSGGAKLGKAGMLGIAGLSGAMAGGLGKNEDDKKSKEDDKNKENIGKPLSEEMKNSKDNGLDKDIENSEDKKSGNDNNEKSNEAMSNKSSNLKNDDKTTNKPTLQQEMNNTGKDNLSSGGLESDNSVSDIKGDLAKDKSQTNKPIDTLEDQMKAGGLGNNNQNPLQEEMKNKGSGNKDNNGNRSTNIQSDLGKEKSQNSRLEPEINSGTIDKKINPKPLQQEMDNNQNGPNEINSNSKNANNNLGTKNNNNNNNISSNNGMSENKTKNNSSNNINASNDANNKEADTKKNTNGKMEDRNISQFISDGFKNSKMTDNMSRAYNLGKNTTSKWNVKKGKGK